MEKEKFFEAIESLKKYRRAELERDGENIVEEVYTDLLPEDYVLKKCLLGNTTFLVGRKGTGKSTIFLRMEKEIEKKEDIMSCYLDVYTTYSESTRTLNELSYLRNKIPEDMLQKYLLERNFIQNILVNLIKQLSSRTNSFLDKIKVSLGVDKKEVVKELLEELLQNIENNDELKKIEIPLIEEVGYKMKSLDSNLVEKNLGGQIGVDVGLMQPPRAKIEGKLGVSNLSEKQLAEEFSKVFIKVFQIGDLVQKIKTILETINIKHLYILLDDFSEIENLAIRNFVNIILAPLNNNSEEFIKFKVAAYPGRYYLGSIDPGKIDVVNLDFYDLYSKFDRDAMEKNSIDFTKRLIKKRFEIYGNLDENDYFEIGFQSINDYYEKLFQVSMNVPRIIGYILSYCYESKTIYNKKILISDIENAAQRYYEEKIQSFFSEIRISTNSMQEKVTALELKKLIKEIINKLDSIKEKIIKQETKGINYNHKQPYTSHFHFNPKLEKYLKTLELNFFISKYNSLSNKDGEKVSIYCLNYGLAKAYKLLWGKPSNVANPRKYFIERIFNFNDIITLFFEKTKSIHCSNSDCNRIFKENEKNALEMYGFQCPSCKSKVIEETISEDILKEVNEIKEKDCLPLPEIKILNKLNQINKGLYVIELSEDLDYNRHLLQWRGKKLDEEHGYITRTRKGNKPYLYKINDLGKEYIESHMKNQTL